MKIKLLSKNTNVVCNDIQIADKHLLIFILYRSMPDSSLLRVASNDQIYMFQTYAEVTSVSPSTGSVKGGTYLTISGQYFDETKSAVRVMVGGMLY